jgi:hypothetical protein
MYIPEGHPWMIRSREVDANSAANDLMRALNGNFGDGLLGKEISAQLLIRYLIPPEIIEA